MKKSEECGRIDQTDLRLDLERGGGEWFEGEKSALSKPAKGLSL